MIGSLLFLVLGLALLLVGSNLLVTSTERFSSAYSISGFTASFFMIGIATSAPEISISIKSALQNETILALGNSIGSNISNIALVFCLSFFFVKHKNKAMALPKNMYIGMIVLTLSLFILILSDYLFDILDALILILVFLVILFFIGREEQKIDAYNGESTKSLSLLKIGLLLIVGVIMLIYGSAYFIDGATQIAVLFGISSYTIGLTLTALGTSLPELATSIESARKDRTDFIIGNIIGSNIFNIAIAASLAGLINSAIVNKTEFIRDISVLLIVSIFFYMIIKSDKTLIKTLYSSILVITYFVYIYFILG
ncbi:MAG: sodium:calcium antiporter [Ectothiorhodospiraceae bacterium]|nr:MAG: sodium:calcium antiporter [Ectothiorhodospiraceae bacterium]